MTEQVGFKKKRGKIFVYLDGRNVGIIVKSFGKFNFKKLKKYGGERYSACDTLDECKVQVLTVL